MTGDVSPVSAPAIGPLAPESMCVPGEGSMSRSMWTQPEGQRQSERVAVRRSVSEGFRESGDRTDDLAEGPDREQLRTRRCPKSILVHPSFTSSATQWISPTSPTLRSPT